MILRPHSSAPYSDCASFIPAWTAVAATQKTVAAGYDLVRQPDHARLSGELARSFQLDGLDDEIVHGISMHDDGWAQFDEGREHLRSSGATYVGGHATNDAGKPLSFLEIGAADFLRAWCGSIDAAEGVAPIAALIVCEHFIRIGKFGVSSGNYSEDDAALILRFIGREQARREKLLALQQRSEAEVEHWTDVLQFCDLLSLYLCCGSRESVEFPQDLGNGAVLLSAQEDVFVLNPSPLRGEVEFALDARGFPQENGVSELRWKMR